MDIEYMKCDNCDENNNCKECKEYNKFAIMYYNLDKHYDISKNDIIKKIREMINNMVCDLDIIMLKVQENKQELEDFEKIQKKVIEINNLIDINDINKENFNILKKLEEINYEQIQNEELVNICISIYKKNFIGIFNPNNILIKTINKNFTKSIYNKIYDDDILIERFKFKKERLFLDDLIN